MPRNRERQKANHKLKMYALAHDGQLPEGTFFDTPETRRKKKMVTEKEWLNHEGYYDLTAYHAIHKKEGSKLKR